MNSIRARLLFYTLLLFTLCWLGVVVMTYSQARHEIEEVFDAQLAQSAGTFAELILPGLSQTPQTAPDTLSQAVYGHKYELHVGFQVWRGDELVFRTQSMPAERFSKFEGFFDQQLDGRIWRVFSMSPVGSNTTVYVGEAYKARNELIAHFVQGALLPLLWALPLVALTIWISIGRALGPLKRVATEVANRGDRALHPLADGVVPTEVMPLTRALNGLLARLREAFDTERRFTADASHELRTPLAGIQAHAEVALAATKAEERRNALASVLIGVKRCTHLVHQMLTLTRLEPEAVNANFQVLNLAEQVRELLADMNAGAEKASVELTLDVLGETDEGFFVHAESAWLAILFRNLIDNAIRHSPAGGTVTVQVIPAAESLDVSVTDEGPGIPPSERERVFERFYRGPDTNVSGCGLGLSIVRRLASLHRGTVTLDAADSDSGLKVVVSFPRAAPIATKAQTN